MNQRLLLMSRFFPLLVFCAFPAQARTALEDMLARDSSYIEDHLHDLTLRVFASRKYADYTLASSNDNKDRIVYKPNEPLNLGLGFNYKFIGINAALNLPFINNDNELRGTTALLDLQTHIYLPRFTLDLYGQFYKGYYISNPEQALEGWTSPNGFPMRPDLKTRTYGIDAHYIFNGKRFSFRSAYLQNEVQQRSSGSLLMGLSAYGTFVSGDSSLIPSNNAHADLFGSTDFNESRVYQATINAGYAYNFVILKKFFITAALTGGIGVNHTDLEYTPDGTSKAQLGGQINTTIRLAGGYNWGRWYTGLQYLDITTRSSAPVPDSRQDFGAGSLRFTVAYRLPVHRNLLGFF